MSKVLSLDELIAKKEQRDAAKIEFKNLYSATLGGELVAKKLPRKEALELIDKISSVDETMSEMYEICKEALYASVKTLREQALQDAYECHEPTEIVDKLFEIEEVVELGTKVIDWNENNLDQAKAELTDEAKSDIKN